MDRMERRDSREACSRLGLVLATLYVLGRTSTRVEEGQFAREYSRLYTALVLALALGLLLLLGAGLASLIRSRK